MKPTATRVLSLVEKGLLDDIGREHSAAHYPSEASVRVGGEIVGRCMRQLWYSHKNVKKTNPPGVTAIMRMEAGNALHDRFGKWLDKAGILHQSEVAFRSRRPGMELPVSGRVDYEIVLPVGDSTIHSQKFGLEVKTGFGRYTSGKGGLKKGPREEHVAQVLPYIDIMGYYGVHLVYLDRASFWRCEDYVTATGWSRLYDSDEFQGKGNVRVGDSGTHRFSVGAIYARWAVLEKFLEEDTPPKRDFSPQWSAQELDKVYQDYHDGLKQKGRAQEPASYIKKFLGSSKAVRFPCDYCAWKETCIKEGE
ncbi:MAG: hypothetical protein J3T61_00565 [Candidatus Brocadiales bacterium]|nr:hypothetical protein [Candidatus Bathyanammoxibius sp.]